MVGNILPIAAIAGAFFLFGRKGKGKSEAKPEDSKSAEDEVAGDVDDAIAEEAQAGGGATIQPSGPPRDSEGTPPFAEPVVVDTGIAGKGAYRVVQLSEQPPVFQAEIGQGMDDYAAVGQFETEEAAIEAAKRAGIERFGAIGR